jgi:hypothetical protein
VPESTRLARENDALVLESTRLARENDALVPESTRLARENDALVPESMRLARENDALVPESMRLAREDDALVPESMRLARDNDAGGFLLHARACEQGFASLSQLPRNSQLSSKEAPPKPTRPDRIARIVERENHMASESAIAVVAWHNGNGRSVALSTRAHQLRPGSVWSRARTVCR